MIQTITAKLSPICWSLACGLLTISSLSVAEEGDVLTAEKFVQICELADADASVNERERRIAGIACHYYVSGLSNGYSTGRTAYFSQLMSKLDDVLAEKEYRAVLDTNKSVELLFGYCAPKGVLRGDDTMSMRDVSKAMITYIKSHPETAGLDLGTIFHRTLRDKYRCD